MICKNCGNEIKDDAKFCPHCGSAVEQSAPFTSGGSGSVYEDQFRSINSDFAGGEPTTAASVTSSFEQDSSSYSSAEPYRAYPEPRTASGSSKGTGIAGMVLGLTTVSFCWVFYIGLVTGIIGIILSAISQKKGRNGFAKAGLITSIIGLALTVILLIAFGILIYRM